MPGNSQRKGAVRKKGKTTAAGSGGRVRRALEGKGPTPRAEDRPYHKSYRSRGADDSAKSSGQRPSGRRPSGSRSGAPSTAGSDWVIGRNPVLEVLMAGLPREQTCWMSHRDTVFEPPPGFTALGRGGARRPSARHPQVRS